jgi:hypothetical protein
LTGQIRGIRGFCSPPKNGMTHFRRGALYATLDVVWARAREVHGIEAVGLAIITNWSVRSSLKQSKLLGALKVWIASAKLFPTGHVKQNLLQHCGVASTLSLMLSTHEKGNLVRKSRSPLKNSDKP